MNNCRKFKLLLWKNWLFRIRAPIKTIFEIILITLASLFLLAIQNSMGQEPNNSTNNNETSAVSISTLVHRGVQDVLLYTPDSDISRNLLYYANKSEFIEPKIVLQGVKNEDELESLAISNTNVFAGISFVGLGNTLTSKLHYRIRCFAQEDVDWKTRSLMSSDMDSNQISNYDIDPYRKTLFLILQHWVASRFIELSSNTEDFMKNNEFYTQPFPYPNKRSSISTPESLRFLLPMIIVLSFSFTLPTLIKNIVREKETGIKELMNIMGYPVWLQFCSWFFNTFIMAMIGTIIIAVVLSTNWNGVQPVISDTSPFIFLLLLILYVSSGISFYICLSTFFSKPSVAVSCSDVIWVVSFFAPYFLLDMQYVTLSISQKLVVLVIPNMTVAWATRIILCYEKEDKALNWRTIFTPCKFWDNLTMMHIFAMLVFDIIFFLTLAWYFDNVLPSIYGTRKRWNFFLTKDYWNPERVYNDIINPAEHHQQENSDDFEAEPIGLIPSIKIINLTKRFGWRKSVTIAVNNISVNMYEGQITALLGHNGAGKTTTMSMLTGMFHPTSGTAYVDGYDIRTHIESVRKNLGLCPQHNMLFDILTVQEHLIFFGSLNVDSIHHLNTEIESLMTKLQLLEKKDTRADKLSGGMMRKLNLGIALVGKPKVVMLDEPTSGLDPEARRAIWDLLLEYKIGSCILLSTHFMEEADVLADRIAIMANGHIVCCGSPIFLKTRFGAGYHINIVKGKKSKTRKTVEMIKSHVLGAYLTTNNENEFSLVLPADQAKNFPDMFRDLESNMKVFGLANFGLSVSTVEEVFFKVGEAWETEYDIARDSEEMVLDPESSAAGGLQPRVTFGWTFRLKQLIGLLLKRWYYTRRRWTLLLAQMFLPAFAVWLGIMLIPVLPTDDQTVSDRALLIDTSKYGRINVFSNENNMITPWYRSSLPPKDNIIVESEPDTFLRQLAINDFQSYSKEYIIGASFENNSEKLHITAWYNAMYYHSLPLSLNLLHNTMLKHATRNASYSLIVENDPLPIKKSNDMPIRQIASIAVYFSAGLSFLSCTFVIFPIHERATMCKQMQFMTGVTGYLFWNVSFMWDFTILVLCSCNLLLVIIIFDSSGLFTGRGQLRLIFLLLLFYGRSTVPLSYLVSLTTLLPATGFTRLSLLNSAIGMVVSIILFTMRIAVESDVLSVAILLCEFLPNFTVTIGLLKILYIGKIQEQCSNLKCTGEIPEYFQWSWPGLNQEMLILMLTAILYCSVLVILEDNHLYNMRLIITKCFKRNSVADNTAGPDATEELEFDVAEEKERVGKILRQGRESHEVLLVADLTKKFRKHTVVRGLNFVVGSGECFGLIGVNGAGKTTTFQMLTGNLSATKGNSFIHGTSVNQYRRLYLANIGYCPQIDPLIDYLTAREMLTVFAYLRGIPRDKIKSIVNGCIDDFDLRDHANKVTYIYSGGNKRKLSVALAFMGDPLVVCLDEPTTGVDPAARRKIRDVLSGANRRGKCVVLTSHSMEECEALCSRVGIMVDGQFHCLGGIQYLKNKFSQGFVIVAKLKRIDEGLESLSKRQNHLRKFIEAQFPSAKLTDIHQGMVQYQIYDKKTKWAYMFETMEKAKSRFNLEDYSVSQATLDQVFLTFARNGRQ